MKCKTRADAENRYGHIDLASGYWPQMNQWIKPCRIPDDWFPQWKVLDSEQVVKIVAMNIDMHEPFLAALRAIKDKGLGGVLKTYDGCFNIRAVRGSSLVSTHAYGLGIDINASLNPLGGSNGDFVKHLDVVKCFLDQAIDWGGNFRGRKDQMHFSYSWE